jgi:hypothetical protein
MGTGHYYFDEMRSSFNLVQNQLFALTKLIIYKTKTKQNKNAQNVHQQRCIKRECEIKSP